MKTKTFKGFVCGTAVAHELGETDVKVYHNLEVAKKYLTCTKECGIIRVLIKIDKQVLKPKSAKRRKKWSLKLR